MERRTDLLDLWGDPALLVDRAGVVVTANPAAQAALGVCPGSTFLDLHHPDDHERLHTALQSLVATGARSTHIAGVRVGGGRGTRHFDVTVVNHLASPKLDAVLVTHHDVTTHVAAVRMSEHRLARDDLTGVATRSALLERLDALLAPAGARAGVLYIDLDRFKTVNDRLGHPVGDAVLEIVAARLATVAGGRGNVGRLGGDEFVVVVEGAREERDLDDVTDRVLATIRQTISVDGHDIAMTASVGVAAGAAPASVLLQRADIALLRAKRAGADRATFAEPESVVIGPERPDDLGLGFVPAFDHDGAVVGVDVAGSTQEPVELRQRVRTAVAWAALWAARTGLPEGFLVSVGLEAHELSEVGASEVTSLDLPPGVRLALEVPEPVLAALDEDTFARLADAGAGLGVRDVGGGALSWDRLVALRPPTVRTHPDVAGWCRGRPNAVAFRMLRAVAATAGAGLVCTGLTSYAQVDDLRRLGCVRVSGPVLSGPLDGDGVLRLLARR